MKALITAAGAPKAIGPYSPAVKVGNMLFLSGSIPLDPVSGQLVEGGITEQTTRVLENIKGLLAAAGPGPAVVAAGGDEEREHEQARRQ